MLNLFNYFKKDRLLDFSGGIHSPERKIQSNSRPLRSLQLPTHFILPLKQHIGNEGEICVSLGDRVLRGQALTTGNGSMLPIHAPSSGIVTKIAPHITAHPSGIAETMCIFITPDGEDRWTNKQPLNDYRSVKRSELISHIHRAGIAGLGGAGFPTATKLLVGLRSVNTLIINAAECEPYITADDRLMQDCAGEVLKGCRILAWILEAEHVMIGIEDNKPKAIAALKNALGNASDLQIRVIPTKYPSGSAKQLTKILTGKEIPYSGHSTDIGILMQNVGTAYAVKRAIIDGEPITKRVITLTGKSIRQPCNIWGRFGTPVSHILNSVDFTPGPQQIVVMGGPLMGFTLATLNVPVVKITNCILAPSASEINRKESEQGCIRCGTCADVCPVSLLPQQLYWYSRGGNHGKVREHNIADCIECGACAWVCPSNIPLVQYFRQEKIKIRAIDLDEERTALTKARFEARQLRLEREKAIREEKRRQTKYSSVTKIEQCALLPSEQDNPSAATETTPLSQNEACKAAVAAAIVRVRARKSQQSLVQKDY